MQTKASYLALGLALGLGGGYLAFRGDSSTATRQVTSRAVEAIDPQALQSGATGAMSAEAGAVAKNIFTSAEDAAVAMSRLTAQHRGIYSRGRALYETFRRIPADQRQAAFRHLGTLPMDVQERTDMLNGFLQIWIEADAPAATAAFSEMAQKDQVSGIDSVAYAWAALDPESAFGWAKGLPAGQIRSSALGHTLSGIARTDIGRALKEIEQLDTAAARWAGAHVYTAWAQRDPLKAAQSALNLVQDKPGGEWALFSVGTQWGRQDPKAALNWIEHGLSHSPLGINMASTIVASASAINPAEVAMLLWDRDTAPYAKQLSAVAVQTWLEQDPAAVRAWFAYVDAEKGAQFLLNAARSTNGIAANVWLPLAEALPASDARTEAMRHMVANWSGYQPENALNYVSQLKDEKLASNLVPHVLTGLANTQPDLALRLALDLREGAGRGDALASIASVWASKNPADATSALAALPPSGDRNYLLANAAAAWANLDPDAALGWANGLPRNDASRDSVFRGVSGNLARSHPTRALDTALQIGNEGTRRTHVDALVQYWMRQDASSAAAWVQSSPLPEADKARLTASAKK